MIFIRFTLKDLFRIKISARFARIYLDFQSKIHPLKPGLRGWGLPFFALAEALKISLASAPEKTLLLLMNLLKFFVFSLSFGV